MFCSCRADYQDSAPNSLVCPVCLGMPGTLPVVNKKAVEYVIMTGLALNCAIATQTKFDRKNYPYPDLMKGYQISQYDQPIAQNGHMTITVEGEKRKTGITRVHLEEDVAKLFHRTDTTGTNYSLLDVNRSGVSLMETVGEPDLRSPEEARQFLIKLQAVLRYLGVSTANMEEGSFRCDANISLRPKGSSKLGSKVEVKNMNSFRAVYRALEHEIERQSHLLDNNKHINQETRGWDENQAITVPQRSKEYAHDYRFFPEPDLPTLVINSVWINQIREALPELPNERYERLVREYGLSNYDASLITSSKAIADFFEGTMAKDSTDKPIDKQMVKSVANWIVGEMARLLNLSGKELSETPLEPKHLREIVDLVQNGTLTTNMAKEIFELAFLHGKSPRDIVKEQGISQIKDESVLESAVQEVLDRNSAAVSDYLNGKESAIRFLTGQVMKETKGQANPQIATKLLIENLNKISEQ